MSEQEQQNVARKILAALYGSWSHFGHLSLNALIAEEKWEKRLVDEVTDKLEEEYGLIKYVANPNVFDLTPEGVLYVEDNGIVSEEEANQHRQVRAAALSYLANLNETSGSHAHAISQDIAKGMSVKHEMDILVDLDLLRDLGHIESVASNSYRITRDGLRFHKGEAYGQII
jgi:hypothetical protein